MKFLKAIQVEELKKLLNSIPKIVSEEEIIPLEEGFNRVVSRDIISDIDVPHFRKSRMDGYAVIAEDSFGAEEDNLLTLKLIETISAGDRPLKKIEKGQCSYVATGAAIPNNANGVVMVEFTEKEGDKVTISKAITPGTHIINIGHDVKKGDIICKESSLIDLPTLGLLSSCGISQVSVYRKPIISLISTGNELLTHETQKLEIGKIYDVNSIVLKKAIENTGAKVKFSGVLC